MDKLILVSAVWAMFNGVFVAFLVNLADYLRSHRRAIRFWTMIWMWASGGITGIVLGSVILETWGSSTELTEAIVRALSS